MSETIPLYGGRLHDSKKLYIVSRVTLEFIETVPKPLDYDPNEPEGPLLTVEELEDPRFRCMVVSDGGRWYWLPHLVHHSPSGIYWGYGGSGPADLARSIVGDYLGTLEPHPAIYQAVKDALIAPLRKKNVTDANAFATETAVIEGYKLDAVIDFATEKYADMIQPPPNGGKP